TRFPLKRQSPRESSLLRGLFWVLTPLLGGSVFRRFAFGRGSRVVLSTEQSHFEREHDRRWRRIPVQFQPSRSPTGCGDRLRFLHLGGFVGERVHRLFRFFEILTSNNRI